MSIITKFKKRINTKICKIKPAEERTLPPACVILSELRLQAFHSEKQVFNDVGVIILRHARQLTDNGNDLARILRQVGLKQLQQIINHQLYGARTSSVPDMVLDERHYRHRFKGVPGFACPESLWHIEREKILIFVTNPCAAENRGGLFNWQIDTVVDHQLNILFFRRALLLEVGLMLCLMAFFFNGHCTMPIA